MTEDDIYGQMILDGDLEITGVNEQGELMHRLTPQGRENYPELYHSVISSVNDFVLRFWNLGYVDIIFGDEEKIKPTELFVRHMPDWPLLADKQEREFAHELVRVFTTSDPL